MSDNNHILINDISAMLAGATDSEVRLAYIAVSQITKKF